MISNDSVVNLISFPTCSINGSSFERILRISQEISSSPPHFDAEAEPFYS